MERRYLLGKTDVYYIVFSFIKIYQYRHRLKYYDKQGISCYFSLKKKPSDRADLQSLMVCTQNSFQVTKYKAYFLYELELLPFLFCCYWLRHHFTLFWLKRFLLSLQFRVTITVFSFENSLNSNQLLVIIWWVLI